VDRSQHTYSASALDELRQIEHEARQTDSLDYLRHYYERVQHLRRTYPDDFDLQLFIAQVQEEIIDHARHLREAPQPVAYAEPPASAPQYAPTPPVETPPDDVSETADASGSVQKLDAKTWQRATYLALFFAVILFAAFFYLVQTARRLNLTPNEAANQQAAKDSAQTGANEIPAGNAAGTPPSTAPTLRLYTDLIPGTYTIDDKEPQDLKDGEIVLDKLEPGRHSIKVTGRNGNAALSFDVAEKTAPRIVGQPTASNVMAVAVSTEGGKGRLVTNADHPVVLLDGKPAGESNPDGITLDDLGTTDHDLQVTEDKDRQRFVLTYAPAPTLTVYVKSDPNAGTVIVMTGQDGADVYIDDKLYRRKTERGQVRIPLKVGEYAIRVHKAGFIDPPPETVSVKKAEESAVEFKLEPAPQIATLEIRGALPGTMVYLDKDLAAAIGNDGNANISTVKPGEHTIELRREQALPKKFERTFHIGDIVVLSGPDVTLEKVVVDNKPAPPPSPPPPVTAPATENTGMEMAGQQVRKGGGFVPYHVPKAPGHYTFQAQARKSGIFKRGKLQWYAGYQDSQNFVLFTLDGKRASIREYRDGKSTELSRAPFDVENNEWVQVDLSVRANTITARIKTQNSGWKELDAVTSSGRDFTQDKVGFYIPGNDEVAVSGFRFSNH
jgi:hypothetical protein